MIKWNDYGKSIEEVAESQLNQYFIDLEKILERQNLFYKKEEVFFEL